MAKREVPFENGEYYHIYNRGVDKRDIFLDEDDYRYFQHMLKLFNSSLSVENARRNLASLLENKQNSTEGRRTSLSEEFKLVEIECFCLMPNHYHLLLKQLVDNGISLFLQKLGTGFTHFFNKKRKRTGVLFQGKTKSKHVGKDNYFEYWKMYIDLNPISLVEPNWKEAGVKDSERVLEFLESYPWQSQKNFNQYRDFLGVPFDALHRIESELYD